MTRPAQGFEHSPAALAEQNAQQLGVLIHTTRKIVRCQSLREIAALMEDAAEQLGLSGWFRAINSRRSVSTQFGSGICREHCYDLTRCHAVTAKITSSDKFVVFKTEYLLLVLSTENLTPQRVTLLRDNLAILVDTLDFWLENKQRLAQQEQEAHFAKAETVNRMNDIVDTMLRFSRHLVERHQRLCQDLLSDLLTQLPVLGLEFDQEESMINMVTVANDEHGKLIDIQIKHNKEMQEVMVDAVKLLLADPSGFFAEEMLIQQHKHDADPGIAFQ